jgi:ribosomal peptide maturation radical SAM protein 1
MKRVLLINMPFAGVEFPSLALGLFKSRLRQEGVSCDVAYLNLLYAEMVGWQNYALVGQISGCFAGEWLFAQTLFGDRIPSDAQYYADVISGLPTDTTYRLAQMKAQVNPFLQMCLNHVPWQAYDIVGFTSLFEQNLPSLALALYIKTYYPDKTIVFGGANCEDIMGLTLHRCFSFVDYVFCGEADDTFPELVKRLSRGQPVHNLPGLVYRQRGESIYTEDVPKTQNLDGLPFPDYDDFYQRLRASPQLAAISPWIVMETSRGCWWGQKAKCTFCGLNGKTIQFLSKSPQRIIDEMRYLVRRYGQYGTGYFRVVDNVINPEYFDTLLPKVADLDLGMQLFFEVRPTLSKGQVKALVEAGVTNVQAGLENLNTHILKLMRKGTSALQNIQLLKWSKQYGLDASWNMIFGFPGEVAEDYAQCLELAKTLTHLNSPVGFGPFRLDRFSYNLEHAAELGLVNVRPCDVYRYLYPFDETTLFDLGNYFDYDRRTPIDDGGLTSSLAEEVGRWQRRQDRLYARRMDGRMVIHDTRPVATSTRVSLEGVPRLIYEICDRIKAVQQIQSWLQERHGKHLDPDEIEAILEGFVDQKLMVKERGRYLSLAVMTYVPEFDEDGN